jgi:DnaJ-class molecular chaperone
MAKNDFTTKIQDGRIMFMTSYRDEFGDTQEVANIITKYRLIEIRDDINRALAELSDENNNCNIPLVSDTVCPKCKGQSNGYIHGFRTYCDKCGGTGQTGR